MNVHNGLIGRLSVQLQEAPTEREVQLRLNRSTKSLDLGPTLVVSANNPKFAELSVILLNAALCQRSVDVETQGNNPPQIQTVTVN